MNDFGTKTTLLIAFLVFIIVSCKWEQGAAFVDWPHKVSDATATVHYIDIADAQNVEAVSRGIFDQPSNNNPNRWLTFK